jgi:Erv1 / Alr family
MATKRSRNTQRHHRRTKKNTYSKEDYESNNGMLTTVWGPGTWHLLHTISFNYPVHPTAENKRHYMDFVKNLENVLPCGKCRKNLKKNFQKLPLRMSDMASRHTFSLYIYRFHELINKMLGKKSGLSYEDVRERYEHFRARCAKPLPKIRRNEKGCTESLYGEKSKCVIKIVPESVECDTFQMDEKCIKRKLYDAAELSSKA